MKFFSTLALIAAAGLAAVQGQDQTLGQIVQALGQSFQADGFSMIVDMLSRDSAMTDLLNSGQNITIFAPVNQAVWQRGNLNPFTSGEFMRYHIVSGVYQAPIDGQAVVDTQLGTQDTPLVKLPSGEAQKLVLSNGDGEGVLNIHFGVPNQAHTLNGGVKASNGYFYPIDTYLLPPNNLVVTGMSFGLDDFMNALNKTGLAAQSQDTVGLTLFIPQREVLAGVNFDAMSEADLTDFVKYHMANGAIYSNDLSDKQMITTQNGKPIKITKDGNNYKVNGHAIVIPNILTENGVIHVIDAVLKEDEANQADPTPSGTPSTPSTKPSTADAQDQGTGQNSGASTLMPSGAVAFSVLLAAVAVFVL